MANTPVDEATPEFDERAVVDAARQGDQGAVGHLYVHYLPRVYRYVAARLGPGEDAEDVTEEIFLRVIDGLDRFRWRDVPFGAWLFRIARNEIVSHVRKQRTRGGAAQLSEGIPDASPGHVEAVEFQMTLAVVREAADRLPEAQRQVIALRFGAGLSVAETAKTLNKSENNVKVLQHKAIARLQKMVRRD